MYKRLVESEPAVKLEWTGWPWMQQKSMEPHYTDGAPKKENAMSLIGNKIDINKGIKEYQLSTSSLLLDVREKEEYTSGHIEGAVNLPLSRLRQNAETVIPDHEQQLFVYCQSGVRSSKATAALHDMGYMNIRNIGGIKGYKGKLDKK